MARRITIEVEVPEGLDWVDEKTLESVVRSIAMLRIRMIEEKRKAVDELKGILGPAPYDELKKLEEEAGLQ